MKICETLECDIGDICEFYKDDGEAENAKNKRANNIQYATG